MGTCIDAIATSQPRGRVFGRGALHLTDVAAQACLRRGHRHATELDLIVNVGLYKDHGLAEPALAAIIQEDIGANPGSPPARGHGTFSFDLADGGCGVVTAARLVDGFVGSAAKLALVVAGDADRARSTSRGFPFAPSGGAVLLSRVDRDVGFRRFLARTFPEDRGLFEVHTRWDPDAGVVRRGRNVLEVLEAPAFADRCVEHGIDVARALLAAEGIGPRDVRALVASPYPASFALRVGRALDIAESGIPRVEGALARAHTAGPIAALEAAFAAGLVRAGYTLILTAGAGISISAALYFA